MTATLIQSPDLVILRNISWQTYQFLVKDFEQQPAMRLTYDRGLLEIRMPLDPHETYRKLLGRLVEALSEELEIEIRSLGSRTCDREDLGRGLEPDQCYYIQNEQAVWDKEQIDLSKDPPPDLAIEVDITSSSINRLDIYTDLGVPEVWRYDGQNLIMYHLENQQYQNCSRSIAFPLLTSSEIERFLNLKKTTKENALIRLFREWVRENLATNE
ncbi:Uma2 family endonuclease [Tolypothrix sp. PCC 7910]|uniref:Uma2 family endonuclease n=1 Tax=Tolypothrix sp. PCC 7910 TaxID=2099387 RepID=UPI0014278FA5|nr:Uma2 family endonuclease [Tolypothrix sp. PCC 7910]QIR40218.1 Uma2 family endonuclease [Tolypothrix sp. PCC 7910]